MNLNLLTDLHMAEGWEVFNIEVGAAPECKIVRVRLFNRNDDEDKDPAIIVYRSHRKPARRAYTIPCYMARRRSDDACLSISSRDTPTHLRKCIKWAIKEYSAIKTGWSQRKDWIAEQYLAADHPTAEQVEFRRKQIAALRKEKFHE